MPSGPGRRLCRSWCGGGPSRTCGAGGRSRRRRLRRSSRLPMTSGWAGRRCHPGRSHRSSRSRSPSWQRAKVLRRTPGWSSPYPPPRRPARQAAAAATCRAARGRELAGRGGGRAGIGRRRGARPAGCRRRRPARPPRCHHRHSRPPAPRPAPGSAVPPARASAAASTAATRTGPKGWRGDYCAGGCIGGGQRPGPRRRSGIPASTRAWLCCAAGESVRCGIHARYAAARCRSMIS